MVKINIKMTVDAFRATQPIPPPIPTPRIA